MDQWPLDDGLAQADEDEEHDKVERADDGKGFLWRRRAHRPPQRRSR